jgi:hypothetical protein
MAILTSGLTPGAMWNSSKPFILCFTIVRIISHYLTSPYLPSCYIMRKRGESAVSPRIGAYITERTKL